MKKTVKSILVSLLLGVAPIQADNSNEWKQSVVLYGWLPSLEGTLTYNLPKIIQNNVIEKRKNSGNQEKTDAKLINNLDGVFMGKYEATKNNWSILSDIVYFKVSGKTQGLLNPNVKWNQEINTRLFSLYGGYNVVDTDKLSVNTIAGIRYFAIGLKAKRRGGQIGDINLELSPAGEHYDAIVGIKGEYHITNKLFMPYQFDIGTGDSDLTWQAETSLGYRFRWGDAVMTYRYIHYKNRSSALINDLNLQGPKLGIVLHF